MNNNFKDQYFLFHEYFNITNFQYDQYFRSSFKVYHTRDFLFGLERLYNQLYSVYTKIDFFDKLLEFFTSEYPKSLPIYKEYYLINEDLKDLILLYCGIQLNHPNAKKFYLYIKKQFLKGE